MTVMELDTVPPGTVLTATVCIIGAGPAGLTLARELAPSTDVLLLESGGREPDDRVDDLNRIESVGAPRVLDQRLVRTRALGGSSATWWGRAAVFDDVDFAPRPWVPGSGWPIPRTELEPYFRRAMPHLGLGIADNTTPSALALVRGGFRVVDPGNLKPYLWSYSRDGADADDAMRFGPAALRDDLPDIRCYLRATVTQIVTDAAGSHVQSLEVRTPDGNVRMVEAAVVVLCAGGIENARILLASDRARPAGVGNAHDVVGRYLMDHLRGPVGRWRPREFAAVQRTLGALRARVGASTVRLVPGVALAADLQEKEALLNCALWVDAELAEDDPMTVAAGVLRRRRPVRDLIVVAKHAHVLVEGFWRTRLRGRSAVRKRASMVLQCIVEQRPDPDSRVTLSAERDALGTPLSVVDWRISDQEAATARRGARLFADTMRRAGLPAPQLDPMILDESAPFVMPDVAHPTGTTRMSVDPASGVVDPDCRVHDVDNLFIAGSSVFPTSGHANPTVMIVALAIRLADHLKRVIGTATEGGATGRR